MTAFAKNSQMRSSHITATIRTANALFNVANPLLAESIFSKSGLKVPDQSTVTLVVECSRLFHWLLLRQKKNCWFVSVWCSVLFYFTNQLKYKYKHSISVLLYQQDSQKLSTALWTGAQSLCNNNKSQINSPFLHDNEDVTISSTSTFTRRWKHSFKSSTFSSGFRKLLILNLRHSTITVLA